MSLRRKIYLVLGLTLAVALMMLYIVSETVFMRGFAAVERREVQEQILRARTALDRDLSLLRTAAFDYGAWDDAISFLEDGNQDFIDRNLVDSFYTSFALNVAVFLRADGTAVYGGGFDLETGQSAPVPAGLAEYLTAGSPLAMRLSPDDVLSGLLALPEGPLLVVSQPVLDSNGRGPARGALVLGAWLDDQKVAALSAATLLPIAVGQAMEAGLPAEVARLATSPTRDGGSAILPLDSQTIAGYTVLDDVFGRPALVMRVDVPRNIYAQGAKSVRYFLFGLIGVTVVFGVVTDRLLRRWLFSRLKRLTDQVRGMGVGRGKPVEVTVGGNDELTLLAGTINTGFEELERAQAQLEEQAQTLASALSRLECRHQDLERAHHRLRKLQKVSASLSSSLELEDALQAAGPLALDILEADRLWLLGLDPAGGVVQGLVAFSAGDKATDLDLPALFGCESTSALSVAGENVITKVVRDREPVFINDTACLGQSEIERLFGRLPSRLEEARALAALPLVTKDGAVGVLVATNAAVHETDPDRRAVALLLASQLALVLKNTRLYEEIKELSALDSLTGLLNRRKLSELLDSEVARARRQPCEFSLLIVDIDRFKSLNDAYGHPEGDEIIRMVASALRANCRTTDVVGRFGGDEFMLILPGTDARGAATVAENLHAAVAAIDYVARDGSTIPLRVSVGAATYPDSGVDAEALLWEADASMYRSKRRRSNVSPCVPVARTEGVPGKTSGAAQPC